MTKRRPTALAIALMAAAFSAHAAPVPAGPAGAAFYVPPVPFPPADHGAAIWARPFDGAAALPAAARNILVLYHSLDPAGKDIAVSGYVAIPRGTPPRGGWPAIIWDHGTTGLASACAPSLDTADGPEHAYVVAFSALLDRFVRRGYAVVATDYQGLGVAGSHPFLQGIPNADNALDMLRAARQVEPRIGARYVVMGHSQGGQADLFTAAEGPAYTPDLKLLGDVAIAPASGIAERLHEVASSPKTELALPYLLYILHSYAGIAPDIDLTRILSQTAIAHLPDLQEGCMTRALTTGYWSTAIASDQFRPDADFGPFLKVAAQNEPAILHISQPTLVMQGLADKTVLPAATTRMVAGLCANHAVVFYRRFKNADHDSVMKNGAATAMAWVAARFAGHAGTGNCAARSDTTP